MHILCQKHLRKQKSLSKRLKSESNNDRIQIQGGTNVTIVQHMRKQVPAPITESFRCNKNVKRQTNNVLIHLHLILRILV